MEFTTFILPSIYASALINDDFCGLEENDIIELNNFIRENQQENCMFYCVGCSEESFFGWTNDCNNLGADCLEYTFNISKL